MAIFSQRMLRGEQPFVNGDGTQTRDYVFVGDVVKANEQALTNGTGKIYNVGTGIETDVNTLFDTIAAQMDHKVERKHREGQPGEQLRSVLDASLINKELGWSPTVNLEEGLRRTVEFFRKKK
ncbi:MAG: GDP-mannose 4,6-dehydratase [Calditrichia bacterium]